MTRLLREPGGFGALSPGYRSDRPDTEFVEPVQKRRDEDGLPDVPPRPMNGSSTAPELIVRAGIRGAGPSPSKCPLHPCQRQMGKARAPDLPGYLLQCGTNPFQLCRIEPQPDRVSGSVSLIELDCAVIKHGKALIDVDRTADDAVPDKYSSGTACISCRRSSTFSPTSQCQYPLVSPMGQPLACTEGASRWHASTPSRSRSRPANSPASTSCVPREPPDRLSFATYSASLRRATRSRPAPRRSAILTRLARDGRTTAAIALERALRDDQAAPEGELARLLGDE